MCLIRGNLISSVQTHHAGDVLKPHAFTQGVCRICRYTGFVDICNSNNSVCHLIQVPRQRLIKARLPNPTRTHSWRDSTPSHRTRILSPRPPNDDCGCDAPVGFSGLNTSTGMKLRGDNTDIRGPCKHSIHGMEESRQRGYKRMGLIPFHSVHPITHPKQTPAYAEVVSRGLRQNRLRGGAHRLANWAC